MNYQKAGDIGAAKRLANLPPMGVIDTMTMFLVTLLTSILGATRRYWQASERIFNHQPSVSAQASLEIS